MKDLERVLQKVKDEDIEVYIKRFIIIFFLKRGYMLIYSFLDWKKIDKKIYCV
jgi:hypothetical protein